MKEDAEQTKPLCFVLDTNVWLKNPLLKDPLGAALLFSVRQMRGFIGLPEVMEQEIIKNVAKIGIEAVETINAAYRTVLILIGSADDYQVPSYEDFESSVKDRLEELRPILKRVSFTLEHAKSALKRVNDETPPNSSKNQQFKDSAIWEAILELSESCEIHFVTEDKGFFESRDTRRGLARSLLAECEASNRSVYVYPDLTSLLSVLRATAPPLDTESLAHLICDHVSPELADFGLGKDYFIRDMEAHTISAFLTERSGILAISFQLTFEAFDPSDESFAWIDYVIVKGDCQYNLDSNAISDLRLGIIEYHKPDGEIVGANIRTTNFGAGGITLGRKRKSYRFQEPLT